MKISKAIFVTGLALVLLLQPVSSVFAQDEESFVRRSVISKKDVIVLSVVFPGLGQMTAGQKYKGISFFLAETASLLFFINSHENYLTKKKVYNRDMDIYNNLAMAGSSEYSEAYDSYQDLKSRSDDLDNFQNTRNAAIVVAGAVYAYNIIDAVFFSSSTSESQRAIRNNKVILSSTMIDSNPSLLLSKSF
ncbi:DUF5683 domain-containing protein [Candidatus Latescibacterota bacterium]